MPRKALHALQATPPLPLWPNLRHVPASTPCHTHARALPALTWIYPEYSCLQSLVYCVFSLPGLLCPKGAAWFSPPPPSLASYRGTKYHLGRKALGVHSTYNGDCHLHHSHFSLSCFSGFSKALTDQASVIICLVVLSLPTADPTRAGTLFCILLHFQYLEQRLAQSSRSINTGWRINEWSPITSAAAHLLPHKTGFCVHTAQGTHIMEKFWNMRSFIFNICWGKEKDLFYECELNLSKPTW